jgi:transketolase
MAFAMARDERPNYVRLPREKTPLFVSSEAEFEIGRAYVLREGTDVALFGTGVMTYQLLLAAEKLAERGISAEVVHVPTVKPLDEQTLFASAQKCGAVLTAEEGQIAGGFGGAVAEFLSEHAPVPLRRIGVRDAFGESGTMTELWQKHGLDAETIVQQAQMMLQ